MIVKHFFEGGPSFMFLIYALWLAVIIVSASVLYRIFMDKGVTKKLYRQNSWVLFLGSFGFLLGIFGQMIGLFQAMRAIESAGDISPALIAGGFKVSLLAPLYGFGLLLFSGIAWFLLRKVIQNRISGSGG
jgi:biopolymer transport protein ExbB/TolQ